MIKDAHFLQSPTWESYQTLEGSKTFRIHGETYSCLAILNTTPLGNYIFCPYGPSLSPINSASLTDATKALTLLAKEQNAFFIRIEPPYPNLETPLQSLGYQKSHHINPEATWVIDLTQPETGILKNMRKTNVQYWRSHSKKGLTIRTSKDPEDITVLTSLLNTVAKKDKFIPQTEAHLKNQLKSGFATLYIAELDPEVAETTPNSSSTNKIPLAASLVYDHDNTRFYAHAAISDAYRKISAGTVLLVQMILDAKAAGATSFDFWGITTSEDPKHPWYGFTKFKQSFGGSLVPYSGTWDLPINSPKYHLYRLIRKTNRALRKFHH